tara:strand:- start:13 stop:492 length:480 start_codon:yes stop_codon:yes gene_type:complete
MKMLHAAIMEASEDKASTTLLLLRKYKEDFDEEQLEMLDAIESVEDLPQEVADIIKDPEVSDLVKQYQQSDEQFSVEKSLVDLDDIIEKPELELVDKQEKVDELKDITAKLISTGDKQSLEIVKEVSEKVKELEVDIQLEQEMKTTKKPSSRGRRRRTY